MWKFGLCKQVVKLGFGATALVTLALINSNIHQMVLCLMKTPVDRAMVAPPAAIPNCSSRTFHHGLDLRVDVCRGEASDVVVFYLENTLLRTFSVDDSPQFVEWLRRCAGQEPQKACPLYATDNSQCPFYAPFTREDYVCYCNHTLGLDHLVINGFRLMRLESRDVVSYIIDAR